MLQLSDPLWRELRGPLGSAENVPSLLTQLREQYDSGVKDELFWEELFHQNTIYGCTYAAVPYLSGLAQETDDPETRLDIYISCGIFEANNVNERDCEVPVEFARDGTLIAPEAAKEIYRAYREALAVLAGMGQSLAGYVRTKRDESEKRYFVAASAAYEGYRDAACMLAMFSGGEEYVLGCPACGEDIYIWPDERQEDWLVVYKNDPVSTAKEAGLPIEVRQPESLEDSGMRHLYNQARLVEDDTLLAHLPYLTGETDCPHCGIRLSVWPELVRTF